VSRVHGASAYGYGCRCPTCREGHRIRLNDERQRRYDARILVGDRLVADVPPERHGTWTTYANYGCQCAPCRSAGTAYNKARR